MKLITVFTSISINEVNLVKSILDSEGIECVILDETIGQLAPQFLFGQGGVRLAVREEDCKAAHEIIDDYENSKHMPEG